eukprot:7316026-Alexandrium_andersonii.AAC.1
MSASLVGSEMCIRDSSTGLPKWRKALPSPAAIQAISPIGNGTTQPDGSTCLLYTSDAADDM